MSPLITALKSCPECQKDATLTNWEAPEGYDPRLRQYLCPNCGCEFYVFGGELSAKLVATEPQNNEPDIER